MTALLASRLGSNEQVFAFVLLSIELFAMLPLLRQRARAHSVRAHLWMCGALIAGAALLLGSRCAAGRSGARATAAAYALAVLFVTLGCPVWLLLIENRKHTINGPWDIAHVQDLQVGAEEDTG